MLRRHRIHAEKVEKEKRMHVNVFDNSQRLTLKFVITQAAYDKLHRIRSVSGDVYDNIKENKVCLWGPLSVDDICEKIEQGFDVRSISNERIHVILREGVKYIRSGRNDLFHDNLDNL